MLQFNWVFHAISFLIYASASYLCCNLNLIFFVCDPIRTLLIEQKKTLKDLFKCLCSFTLPMLNRGSLMCLLVSCCVDVRHASCVGACACVHALRRIVYTPPLLLTYPPQHHHIETKKILQDKARLLFFFHKKGRVEPTKNWPVVPLDPVKREVMRWWWLGGGCEGCKLWER